MVIANNSRVEVARGGSVEVVLKGIERNNNPLRYSIAAMPKHGRLTGLLQPDPNRQGFGRVLYTHGDDDQSQADTFTYRATAPISGRSATGTVTVVIRDLPPRLGAPRSLAFAVVVGESDIRKLSLTNTGGGILLGELRVHPPFFVDGDPSFELPRGRSTHIPLRYTPTETGRSAPQRIKPSPADPASSVVLEGEANAPFALQVPSDKLALNDDGSRTAEIEVTGGRGTSPREVRIDVRPADLAEIAEAVTVEYGSSEKVMLRIPPDRKSGTEKLEVVFFAKDHAETLRLEAPAVPAHIEIVTPVVDFGDGREADLIVRNTGGVDGRFTIDLPSGLTSLEGAANFTVPPGREKNVRLRWTAGKDTPVPTELTLQASGREPEKVAVHRAPPSEQPAETSTGDKTEPPSVTADKQAPSSPQKSPPTRAEQPGTLRIAPQTQIAMAGQKSEMTASTIVLALPWRDDVRGYRAERLQPVLATDPATGRPIGADLKPTGHEGKVTISQGGRQSVDGRDVGLVIVAIDGLEPGSATPWRLVPQTENGELAPTNEFWVKTLPRGAFPWRKVVVGAACAALAAILFLRWKQRRA